MLAGDQVFCHAWLWRSERGRDIASLRRVAA